MLLEHVYLLLRSYGVSETLSECYSLSYQPHSSRAFRIRKGSQDSRLKAHVGVAPSEDIQVET